MSTTYIAGWQELDIVGQVGNSIDETFAVYLNCDDPSDPQSSELETLTGKQIDMTILNLDGSVLKSLSSAGTSPAITISGSTYNVSTAAITSAGKYPYYVDYTDGGNIYTIQKGDFIIKEKRRQP